MIHCNKLPLLSDNAKVLYAMLLVCKEAGGRFKFGMLQAAQD